MKRYSTKYCWLDDFGDTIRITSWKPSHVKWKVLKECIFDSSVFEEALF